MDISVNKIVETAVVEEDRYIGSGKCIFRGQRGQKAMEDHNAFLCHDLTYSPVAQSLCKW